MSEAFRLSHYLGAILLLAAGSYAACAATVEVNGLPDSPPSSYATLSGAVGSLATAGAGPHVINITTDTLSIAEGQIYIDRPVTIEGDGNGNGIPCDILVDLASIQMSATTNIGGPNKGFLDVRTSGAVTIRNLKIHPNADGSATGAPNAVNGIQLFRPSGAGETANYTLEKVWISGSLGNNYVSLATSDDLFAVSGIKRWSRNVEDGTAANGDAFACIVVSNNGVGDIIADITNCHAGLSRSTALSINGGSTAYTTATITGGLFGHSLRDGIHVEGDKAFTYVTIQGTPTNRVRVLRVPHQTGKDAHGIEFSGATAPLLEYADVQCMLSGNAFKFGGDGVAHLVQYCRGLGKFDDGDNSTVFVTGAFQLPDVRNSTFVGSGADFRPIQVAGTAEGDVNFTDTIFVSENLRPIAADNTDTTAGIQNLTNCAIPTDGTTSESLNVSTPITNGAGAFLPTPVNPVNSSPWFVRTRLHYDWSEAAVSINGSNLNAGNPNVLRPSNPSYATAATDNQPLVGGAGPAPAITSARDWQQYF